MKQERAEKRISTLKKSRSQVNSIDTNIILEQWKLYSKSAEKISEERQQFINWFNGINTLIVAAFAGILKFVHIDHLEQSLLMLRVLPPLLGVVISLTAIVRILIYRERKRIKYKQIYEIEKHLPFKLYTKEYRMRKEMDCKFFKRKFCSGTRIELFLPSAFALVYISILLWALISLF